MATLLQRLILNIRTSSEKKSDIPEKSNCSPVTAIRTGDLIDSPTMLDLVVRVERVGGTVWLTTNRGTTEHHESDTVDALRREKHERTGDYRLVPVR